MPLGGQEFFFKKKTNKQTEISIKIKVAFTVNGPVRKVMIHLQDEHVMQPHPLWINCCGPMMCWERK